MYTPPRHVIPYIQLGGGEVYTNGVLLATIFWRELLSTGLWCIPPPRAVPPFTGVPRSPVLSVAGGSRESGPGKANQWKGGMQASLLQWPLVAATILKQCSILFEHYFTHASKLSLSGGTWQSRHVIFMEEAAHIVPCAIQ